MMMARDSRISSILCISDMISHISDMETRPFDGKCFSICICFVVVFSVCIVGIGVGSSIHYPNRTNLERNENVNE
jgi:hypothetical protein